MNEVDPPALAANARCAAHPEREARSTCVRCGDYACEPCLRGDSESGPLCARCVDRAGDPWVAWERRRELGLLAAFVQSTREIMLRPTRFFETPPRPGGVFGALFYGAAAYTLGQAMFMITYFGMIFSVGASGEIPIDDAGGFAILASMIFMLIFSLVWLPVQAAIGIVIDAACVHGTLMISGGARAPFEQTLRASAYSNGSYMLGLIPCVGFFFGWLWMHVTEIIAISETHAIGRGHAAFAVLGYRALLFLVVAIFYGAMIAVMFSAFGPQTN